MTTLAGRHDGAVALAAAASFEVTHARYSRWAVPAGHLLLLWHCLRHAGALRNVMVRAVFLRQVYFIGVQGLRVVALLAFTTGALIVAEATQLLGATNDYLYGILRWILVTHGAPLLVAIVVIGRSATAIATELALMRVRGEMRFLENLRIDPRDYLVVPRVAALTVSLAAATLYFQIIAVIGGFGTTALLLNVSFAEQMQYFLAAIPAADVLIAAFKTIVFGLVVGVIGCFAGLHAGHTVNDVPRAQIAAYMRSLTLVIAIDVLFALGTL